MLRKAIGLIALALGAYAGAQTYAQRSVPIHAGVVVIESQRTTPPTYATNYAPHVFYNLESNRRILPANYALSNPAHPSVVTPEISARWTLIAGSAPAVGTRIEKRHGPYWEVNLSSISESLLSEFDFLLLPAHGYVSLNPLERERLRRFMDRGGILWIDLSNPGSSIESLNNLPLPFDLSASSGFGSLSADYFDPAMSYPNAISASDLVSMNIGAGLGLIPVDLTALGYGALVESQQWIEPDFSKLNPIASDDFGVLLAAGRVGDGFEVITTRAVASTLNRVPLPAPSFSYDDNLGFTALTPAYDRGADAAAKLFVNLVTLASGFKQVGGGSQKDSSSPIDVAAPLVESFRDEDESLAPSGGNAFVPPAIGSGVIAVTMSDTHHIHVYDADPSRDLDGDGDPDDGIRDYSLGSNVDKLWSSDAFLDPISPPIIYEVPEESGDMRIQVAIIDSEGTLHVWSALQLDVNGHISPEMAAPPDYSVAPPTGFATFSTGDPMRGPYAPTFHEGLLYIADAQDAGGPVGRVWIVDPETRDSVRTGTGPGTGWSVGGAGSNALPEPSGSPTVGYIPINDNSGGVDKVVYVPGRPSSAFAGPNATAGLTSIWVGARGERPVAVTEAGGFLTVATRASNQGLSIYLPQGFGEAQRLGVKLTIVKSNGDPMTAAEMSTYFSGTVSESSGILTFQLTGTPLPGDYSVRLDYHIDWGTGNLALSSQIVRGALYFPDDTNKARRVVGNVALSAKGTIQLVTSTQSPSGNAAGGSFWTIREEGRGLFKILNRWDLYNQHNIVLNQATPVSYPEALTNLDPVVDIFPPLAGTLGNLTFMSGPAVRNGVAYVTALAIKPGLIPIPYLILLAFDAEPEAREIITGDLQPGFTLVQPDMLRSTSKTDPEIYSALQSTQYTYDQDPSTASGRIRIDSLSATTRGPIVNSISTSMPIIIRRPGAPDLLVEPEATGSRWNPLLWYAVLQGVAGDSTPVVTGNTVYVAGTSSLPTFLKTGAFTPTAGLLFALDADISPTDSFIGSDPDRPWLRQLYELTGTSIVDAQVNPAFRWPQLKGIESGDDLRMRILQSTLGPSTAAYGVVAGDGTLVSWSDTGLYAYKRADLYVADEGRALRIDAQGNPIWSMSSTTTGGALDVGGAANARPLVHPTRVYPINDRESILVDSGASRVVRLDASGRELRSIESLVLDPQFVPDGYQAGESLQLKSPRDVSYFTGTVAFAANPFSNASAYEFWRHYLIADGANKRLIELVDRYAFDPSTGRVGDVIPDSNGEPGLGVLYWHSPSNFSGSGFEYNSLARVYTTGLTPGYAVAAGIGNQMPTRTGAGLDSPTTTSDTPAASGNGGIVVFDGTETEVISSIVIPAFSTELWTGSAFETVTAPERVKRIGSLNSVTMRNVPAGADTVLAIMFTDASGVYEVMKSAGQWQVIWMLPRKISGDAGGTIAQYPVYTVMRRDGSDLPTLSNPRDFVPSYAKRLTSGDVLVVNAYVGSYPRSSSTDPWQPFSGEILQLDGGLSGASEYGFDFSKRNFGFESLSIRFALPPVVGTRSLMAPVFAIRR